MPNIKKTMDQATEGLVHNTTFKIPYHQKMLTDRAESNVNPEITKRLPTEILQDPDFKKLQQIARISVKYNGLCELICNYLIKQSSLLEEAGEEYQQDRYQVGSIHETNPLDNKLTLNDIAKEQLHDTHILEVTSLLQKITAYLFKHYPYSELSFNEQRDILQTFHKHRKHINSQLLNKKLDQLDDNHFIKFMKFNRRGFTFDGHSMLIKKVNNESYHFFDPVDGAYLNLNKDQLSYHINKTINQSTTTDIALLDGDRYLKDLNFYPEPHQQTHSPSKNN